MNREWHRRQATEVSLAAAAVNGCVAVQDLFPKTVQRHTHAVVLTDDRREIADKKQLLIRIPSSAKEANDAPLRVITIHPFKAGGIGVPLQRGIAAVQSIKITQPMPQPSVKWISQQVPLQAAHRDSTPTTGRTHCP